MTFNLLIVGLGNPGGAYEKTRHNLGSFWVKKLCQRYAVKFVDRVKLGAKVAELNEFKTVCMLSTDYMNNNGSATKLVANFYKLLPENILVIHDELNLPTGRIKLKLSGGHGGHNGVKDLIFKLNSDKFKRLRIGIGNNSRETDLSTYVLSRASYAEQTVIEQAIDYSISCFPEITQLNWNKTMQLIHNNNLAPGEQS